MGRWKDGDGYNNQISQLWPAAWAMVGNESNAKNNVSEKRRKATCEKIVQEKSARVFIEDRALPTWFTCEYNFQHRGYNGCTGRRRFMTRMNF